jgi:hypothetical protein
VGLVILVIEKKVAFLICLNKFDIFFLIKFANRLGVKTIIDMNTDCFPVLDTVTPGIRGVRISRFDPGVEPDIHTNP